MRTKTLGASAASRFEKRKPIVRSAPKPPAKRQKGHKHTFGTPFSIINPVTGKVVLEGHLLVIPDAAAAPSRPMLPCLPAPTVLRRRQFACLLREWRNHPDTTLAERNSPTVSDLIGMVMRRMLDNGQLLTSSLA